MLLRPPTCRTDQFIASATTDWTRLRTETISLSTGIPSSSDHRAAVMASALTALLMASLTTGAGRAIWVSGDAV